MAKRKELGTQASKKKIVRASRRSRGCGAPASPATTPADAPMTWRGKGLDLLTDDELVRAHGEAWHRWRAAETVVVWTAYLAAQQALSKEWFRRNPDKSLLGIPDEAQASPSVGAVASESERVATSNPSLISRLYTWATGR